MPAKHTAGEEVGAAVTPEEEFRALELAIVGAKVALVNSGSVGANDKLEIMVGGAVVFAKDTVARTVGTDEGTIDELEILVGGAVVFTNGDEVTLTEIFAAFTECFYD